VIERLAEQLAARAAIRGTMTPEACRPERSPTRRAIPTARRSCHGRDSASPPPEDHARRPRPRPARRGRGGASGPGGRPRRGPRRGEPLRHLRQRPALHPRVGPHAARRPRGPRVERHGGGGGPRGRPLGGERHRGGWTHRLLGQRPGHGGRPRPPRPGRHPRPGGVRHPQAPLRPQPHPAERARRDRRQHLRRRRTSSTEARSGEGARGADGAERALPRSPAGSARRAPGHPRQASAAALEGPVRRGSIGPGLLLSRRDMPTQGAAGSPASRPWTCVFLLKVRLG